MTNETLPTPFNDILLYSTPSGAVKVEVLYEDETFWLSQKRLAELFGVAINTINEHLRNIYEVGELQEQATIRKIRRVQQEGTRQVNREVEYYNLDVIIAVGYRVNSIEATQFRIWSTQTLKEYIIKGFVLDDDRLKLNKRFGIDYFDELLEKIREIRASERRFYQKVTDIFKECSIDYAANSPITTAFYQTVQNKLEWAITGMTAAEIIHSRANAQTPKMGLKTWKNAPDGKILKSDVSVAKNYLTQDEIKALERIVSMYLDYAENQASRGIKMHMSDWIEKLDAFLRFNDYEVLANAGKISAEIAKQLAEGEYEKMRVVQDREYISDFDRMVKTAIKRKNSDWCG